MPIGNGSVMIGMGERTAPQAVAMIARKLFTAGSAGLVVALPRLRSYMHLNTVRCSSTRDALTLFPEGARVDDPDWRRRAGTEREQCDDGDNLLCVEPGVVVAYVHTNTRLRSAGVEVITVSGSELRRAAGHRTACPARSSGSVRLNRARE
jgi:arginine deiminase